MGSDIEDKTLRWCEISASPSKMRFETLSRYMNENGVKNEFFSVTATKENLSWVIEKCQKDFEQIRIAPPFRDIDVALFERFPVELYSIRAMDAIVRKQHAWWPRTLLYESFLSRLPLTQNLDISSPALVVGSGASARMALAALVKLGFKVINVSSRDRKRGEQFAQEMRSLFFQIEFQHTVPRNLTNLPGIYSVVVNATPLTSNNELLEELSYFNFLSRGGTLVDLSVENPKSTLVEMASGIGAQVIDGWDLAAISDGLWLEMICSLKSGGSLLDLYRSTLDRLSESETRSSVELQK